MTLALQGFGGFHLVDYISIGFGLIATYFAIDAKRELREAKKDRQKAILELKELKKVSSREHKIHTEQLDKQAANVAVAKFPDNLPALRDFILGAESDLSVMVDCVGYALYSKPSEFEGYMSAIETALAKKVSVRMLLYSLDTLRSAVARQIPRDFYEKTERHSERCATFFQMQGRAIPESYEEFRDLLLEKEQDLMLRFQSLRVKVVDHRFSAFCWMRDGASLAMFAFRNDGLSEGGLTFRTIDIGMRNDFKAIFESEWEGAAKPIYRNRW